MRITVWNERAESEQGKKVLKAYPDGMQKAIIDIFKDSGHSAVSANLAQVDDGLSAEVLDKTDVLIYWAHCLHDKVSDATVERIAKHVEDGKMSVIFLHSAHFSKLFKKLSGRSGSLKWREDGRHERLYNVNPNHPIAQGIPEWFTLEKEEMYGEYFDIPTPDDLVFVGWFPGGEVFRSGFTYHYGKGKFFYFQPGHETYSTYYNEYVKRIIFNAALWLNGETVKREKSFVTNKCSFSRGAERTITLRYKAKVKE